LYLSAFQIVVLFIVNPQNKYCRSINIQILKPLKNWVWILFLFSNSLIGNTIDIGIFESTNTGNVIEINIIPDFDIAGDQTITAILYTLRWNDPLITIETEYIFPFFVAPQGDPVEYNGFYYQVFAAVPFASQAMTANQEYTISSYSYTNGECATFEIIEDEWTAANNGNVYLEFLGSDVTGEIYHNQIVFGSLGGMIEGSDTIHLGQSSGMLTLSDHNGLVLSWQKRLNNNAWGSITATAGLTSYSDTPTDVGTWEYRCEVQQGTCEADYSQPAQVLVLDTVVAIPLQNTLGFNSINIFSSSNQIHIERYDGAELNGELRIYNLFGQEIYKTFIIDRNVFRFNIEPKTIFVIIYKDTYNDQVITRKIFTDW